MAQDEDQQQIDATPIISGACNHPLQIRKERPDAVTKVKRLRFLEELAATCNVGGSAAAAGISVGAAYRWRVKDPAFRNGWEQALEQGYAGLEAALLAQAQAAATADGPETDRTPVVGGMDAKLALTVLQNHQRTRGREPGDANPRRSDLKVALDRLEKALKRFAPPSVPDKTEAGGKPDDGQGA